MKVVVILTYNYIASVNVKLIVYFLYITCEHVKVKRGLLFISCIVQDQLLAHFLIVSAYGHSQATNKLSQI